eukprot:Nk52_evm27s212 gene=Nk52_evmTU27s212
MAGPTSTDHDEEEAETSSQSFSASDSSEERNDNILVSLDATFGISEKKEETGEDDLTRDSSNSDGYKGRLMLYFDPVKRVHGVALIGKPEERKEQEQKEVILADVSVRLVMNLVLSSSKDAERKQSDTLLCEMVMKCCTKSYIFSKSHNFSGSSENVNGEAQELKGSSSSSSSGSFVATSSAELAPGYTTTFYWIRSNDTEGVDNLIERFKLVRSEEMEKVKAQKMQISETKKSSPEDNASNPTLSSPETHQKKVSNHNQNITGPATSSPPIVSPRQGCSKPPLPPSSSNVSSSSSSSSSASGVPASSPDHTICLQEISRLQGALAESTRNQKEWQQEIEVLRKNNALLVAALHDAVSCAGQWHTYISSCEAEKASLENRVIKFEDIYEQMSTLMVTPLGCNYNPNETANENSVNDNERCDSNVTSSNNRVEAPPSVN